MQEERHVVAFDLQIALVDIGGKRQRIQLFGVQLRPRSVVNHLAVLAVAGAQNLLERLAVRVLRHGVIEFPAHRRNQCLRCNSASRRA